MEELCTVAWVAMLKRSMAFQGSGGGSGNAGSSRMERTEQAPWRETAPSKWGLSLHSPWGTSLSFGKDSCSFLRPLPKYNNSPAGLWRGNSPVYGVCLWSYIKDKFWNYSQSPISMGMHPRFSKLQIYLKKKLCGASGSACLMCMSPWVLSPVERT